MSETKFTPGPYVVHEDDRPLITHKPYSVLLPGSNDGVAYFIATKANAHLLAAAPELYEALAEITRDDGDVSAVEAWADDEAGAQWFARAHTALKKARGEA